MIPVRAGESTPPRLPTAFWIPVHEPAANGPANVCVIAHTLDVKKPNAEQLTTNSAAETCGVRTTAAGSRVTQQSSIPPATNVLRTLVTPPPAAIHRSDHHPPIIDVAAIAQNGNDPKTATLRMERPRSLIR